MKHKGDHSHAVFTRAKSGISRQSRRKVITPLEILTSHSLTLAPIAIPLCQSPLRHDLALNGNDYNSCFIDSTFEMLWHSILPALPMSYLDRFDLANDYDAIIIYTYRRFQQNTTESREKASNNARDFC
jgi:hypothetical protein